MFIHWGPYAIPAGVWKGKEIPGIGEWILYRARIPVAEYEQLAKQFNPVKFNAGEWVSLAKNAGQKYLVITSKHHDGFCMFKSGVGDYDIVDATILASLAPLESHTRLGAILWSVPSPVLFCTRDPFPGEG